MGSLKLHWTATGGTGSFAQPIVSNNLVYWGDWNGLEHATDLTGHDVWTMNVGADGGQRLPSRGRRRERHRHRGHVRGTGSIVYVPGGDGNMYALNTLTGAVIWKTYLGTPDAAPPALYNCGRHRSCSTGASTWGSPRSVTARSSRVSSCRWTRRRERSSTCANMVPNGCVGAGIWTSPTVDPSDGSIYVTTGTPNTCHQPGDAMAPSIVKLRASDLAILSFWTVPTSEQVFGDEDFGGTPTLFTATINGVPRALVGALNKDGLFFAWDRNNVAAGPVWQSTVADPSGSPRSIVSASWDGKYLYVGGGGATINGASCYGNISALDPATGAFVWRSCQTSFMTAGLTEVPGHAHRGCGCGRQRHVPEHGQRRDPCHLQHEEHGAG